MNRFTDDRTGSNFRKPNPRANRFTENSSYPDDDLNQCLLDEPEDLQFNVEDWRKSAHKPKSGGLMLLIVVVAAVFIVFRLMGGGSEKDTPPNHAATHPKQTTTATISTTAATIPPATTVAVPQVTQPPQQEPLFAENPYSDVYYCRPRLTPAEQNLYDEVVWNMRMLNMTFPVEGVAVKQVERVMRAVWIDHPEFFWYKMNYVYYTVDDNNVVKLEVHSFLPEEDIPRMYNEIRSVSEEILSCYRGAEDYEAVKGIYETLVNRSTYDFAYDMQGMYSLLVQGRGVCVGYARATQYLLQQMGIPCEYVKNEDHAWVIARIDGEDYHVDTTWGDPVNPNGKQTLNYDYLCLTTSEIIKDHDSIDDPYGWVPYCTAVSANYFVHEGLRMENRDISKVDDFIRNALNRGADFVTFQVSDPAYHRELYNNLLNNGELYDILNRIQAPESIYQTIALSSDENFQTIKIYFHNND